MNVGTDADGRPIMYDEVTQQFSVGGIATTIDRLSAYDRGGQVSWASEEVRDWAHEFNRTRQEFATQQGALQADAAARREAEQREAAKRLRPTAQGYSPDGVVKLAGFIKGFATTLIVLFVIGGVVEGLALGVLLGTRSPVMILVAPVFFGGFGYFFGYLLTIFMKAAADLMLAVVQIEMNTRGAE